MKERILVVDDDSNLLSGIERHLKAVYEVRTALSGARALEIIEEEDDFAVVLSDYKMPGMNGDSLLARVRALRPETVRVMLTGQADMEAVVAIVNEGEIFRFLTKPCPPELLKKNIEDSVRQYRLQITEKDLMSRTLGGTLQVIMDFLVLSKPQAFKRGLRARDMVKKMLPYLQAENEWQVEVAAMLSQIGCITVPDDIIDRIYRNIPVPPEDKLLYQLHAKTSSDIIKKIPRLNGVASIIEYQEKYYNGTGIPNDSVKGGDIPLGSRILRAALDYEQLKSTGMTADEILAEMKKRAAWYDPAVLKALIEAAKADAEAVKLVRVMSSMDDLAEEMLLAGDVVTNTGLVLGTEGQKVTRALIATLKNHAANGQLEDTVEVMAPA